MRVLWICGLPEEVRVHGYDQILCPYKCAAWGWVLGHLPPPRGGELHVVCMVRDLIAARLDFSYLGVQWHCFKELRGEQYLFRIPSILCVRRFVKTLVPEVVNGWGGETGCGWIATWVSRTAFVNVQGLLRMLKANEKASGIVSHKGRWLDWKMRQLIESLTYCRATRIFCESNQSSCGLRKYYGCESEVIYQPLRRQFLSSSSCVQMSDVPTFLYVGEMVERKGPMDVLLAFSKLRDKSVKLIMLGAGPLEVAARQLVVREGLQSRVRLDNGLEVEELIEVMRSCDFFILPSYGDTGPTALKEAMSQGLFPICYNNTGPKEHIERYGFGRLCATGVWQELTEAMEYAVGHRSELRERGREIAKLIRADLSPENIWPKIIHAYKEVV